MATKSTNAKLATAMKQAMYKMSIMDDVISVTSKRIGKRAADDLVKEIVLGYNSFISGLEHDHQNRNGTIIYAEPTEKGYTVIVEGPQVIYDEFGTGTEGLSNPHPTKNYYNLNGYNSGFYIKTNKNGEKYWIYYSEDIDRYVTSHGVPAGCFMYDALMKVSNEISDNIMFEEGLKAVESIADGKIPSDEFGQELYDNIFG